jgi:hypothetical protein
MPANINNDYSELTAADRLAEERAATAAADAAAAAAARAQRAPTDMYNAGLNTIDQMDAGQRAQNLDIDAYRNNTDGFQVEADTGTRNRRLSRTVLWTVLVLVPVDAFLALSGIARQVLEWISGIISADGRGLATIPSWAVIGTATILSIALWALTLGIKAGTSTVLQKARLQISTSAVEISRLRWKMRWKIAGRVGYLLGFAVLLWTVHEDVRRRLDWMHLTSEQMRQQAVQDQQAASMILGGGAAPTPPTAIPSSTAVNTTSVGLGAEAFVLAVLFALHAMILCVVPSFTPVNPFGPQPFNLRVTEDQVAADKVTMSRLLRNLWDQLNDMPADQRQGRVDAMPARIADLLNAEFGRPIIITQGPPPEDPPSVAPAPRPVAPRPGGPIPNAAAVDEPAPDPMIGVV